MLHLPLQLTTEKRGSVSYEEKLRGASPSKEKKKKKNSILRKKLEIQQCQEYASGRSCLPQQDIFPQNQYIFLNYLQEKMEDHYSHSSLVFADPVGRLCVLDVTIKCSDSFGFMHPITVDNNLDIEVARALCRYTD